LLKPEEKLTEKQKEKVTIPGDNEELRFEGSFAG
jgi:hypothetical protein